MALSPYHHIIQAATEHHGRTDHEDSDYESSFGRKSNHMPSYNKSDLEISSYNSDGNVIESDNENEHEYKNTLGRTQPSKRSRNASLNDSRETHTESEDYDSRRFHDRTNNLSKDNLEKASFDKQTSFDDIHSPEFNEIRKSRSANTSPIAPVSDINSTAEPSLHDDSSLANTNRLISDLERKLSIMSTSSSNQTHQSQGSSVIVNKSMAGMGKESIQSSVLQYIKSEEDKTRDTHNNIFNPNELFQDRQSKFLTKFGKSYNDDSQRKMVNPNHNQSGAHLTGGSIPDANGIISPVVTPNLDEISLDAVEVDDPIGMDTDSSIHISRDDSRIAEQYFLKEKDDILDQNEEENVDDEDDHEEHANHSGMYGIFFNDNSYDDDFDPDDNDDDDNFEPTDELLLPPSPPRSPPRDLDPDKLYGLYDFSGPDPSHCSLTRDEPVYLINDQDNYWWLIRKLNKEERKMHVKSKKRNDQGEIAKDYDSLEDDYTDEEDGKIGFVPAECLETYGERLARLNCFKNEELERSSKDSLVDSQVFGNTVLQGESQLFQSEDNLFRDNGASIISNKSEGLSRSSSLLKRSGSKKNNNSKSVTFENIADIQLHEEEEDVEEETDDTDLIREQQKKAGFEDNGIYNIPQEDIQRSDEQQDQDEEKKSEVLSDVYPAETPLIISKNSKNNKKKLSVLPSTLTQDTVLPLNPRHSLEQSHEPVGSFKGFLSKPPSTSNTFDQASIGSFSPDTPPSRFVKSYSRPSHLLDSPSDELDEVYMSPNSGMLRRSEILDRLTKVTSDIEEQLAFSDLETNDDEELHEEANVTKVHASDRSIVDLFSPHSIKEKHRGVVIVDDGDNYEDRDILDADAHVSDIKKPDECNISKSDIEKEVQEIQSLPVEVNKVIRQIPKESSRETTNERPQLPQEISDKIKETMTEKKQSLTEINQNFEDSSLEMNNETEEIDPQVVFISDESSRESLPVSASLSTPPKSDNISDDIPNDSINMGAIEEVVGTTPVSLSSKDSAATITDFPSEPFEHIIHSSPISKEIDSSPVHRGTPDVGKSVESLNVREHEEEEEEDDDDDNDDDDDEYDDDDDDDDDNVLNGGYPADITPLTSMNSLNYGSSSTPTPSKLVPTTDVSDKRKSRPVHDMFMPILGKFDELAEKLAELDGML